MKTNTQLISIRVSSLLLLAAVSGCATAASLGLPVLSGSHRLMDAAKLVRQAHGSPSNTPSELAMTVQQPHRVEAGDVMQIEANDFNSPVRLPGDQTVQADGTIELGAYGSLSVAGMTVIDVQQKIQTLVSTKEASRSGQTPIAGNVMQASSQQAAAQPGFAYGALPGSNGVPVDNSISVRLVRQEGTVFYVLGEVNAPGSYPLVGNETVLDAIIAAGGVTALANEHKIILSRPSAPGAKRIILPVCYQSIVQLGDTAANYQIYPGDRIYIPSLTLTDDIRQSIPTGHSNGCAHCEIKQ